MIHNDGNDWNVLVTDASYDDPRAAGLIDFGDVLETWTVAGPAIAMAYVMLDKQVSLTSAEKVSVTRLCPRQTYQLPSSIKFLASCLIYLLYRSSNSSLIQKKAL